VISRTSILALSCFVLAACAQDEAPEFCSDHALFHAEHLASNAHMSVTMTEDGEVRSEIRLPVAMFGEDSTSALLLDINNAYALQTDSECSAAEVSVSSSQGSLVATYSADCGADNKLKQVDVLLFESLPALNEVEVTVVTPVTQKQFAINRRCESAIFRLE
jgi:hypothetical protein